VNSKVPNLRLQLAMLLTLLAATVFLWEIAAPFTALAEVGYLIPILYIIWFPLENRNGVILVSVTTVLIAVGFIVNYSQIEDSIRAAVTVTHALSIAVMWLAIFFNTRYGKTLRKELRNKEQLNAVFNYATEGILIVDQLGKIVLVNSFAEKLLGYQSGELLGHSVDVLVPMKVRPDHHQKVMGFMSNPKTEPLGSGRELMAVRKDGHEVPVEIALSYFRNADGLFVIAFIVDLTERRKAEEKIKQEQKLADTYFEMAPALFLVLDVSGKVVTINEYGCQLLGYKKDDVINRNWFETFVPEDDRSEAQIQFEGVKLGSPEYSCESPVLNASGEEIEMSWKHIARKEDDRTIVLCSGMDISARKKQERLISAHHQAIQNLNEELEQKVRNRTRTLRDAVQNLERVNKELDRNQKFLTTAIHYFPEGVIGVMNKDLRYIFADGQELQALGLHGRGEHERVFDNVHPALSSIAEEKLKWVFTGSRLSYDVEMDDKTYNVNAVPIPNHDDQINEIMVVIRNITERKRIEDKLLKSIDKERELAQMKSKFVTMASHEFRTPLTTILSSTFLLENYVGAEHEQKRVTHFNRIKQAVKNMTELLDDFIQLGKLEEGKIKIALTSLDVRQLREELEPELEAVRKEGQTLRWEFSGEEQVVNLDKQLLRSILINLIGNALKYSPPGAEVKVVVSATHKEMKVQVIDHGIGIPFEEQPHIFKRFFRAQNSVNIGGTGLGLNIARKHVKLMKGRIEFKSKLNEGTVFTVTLPLENEKSEKHP
jgi:PAS domain S-box-containing protein